MEKQMTLAEAMMLGAEHMKPLSHLTHLEDWSEGCALGMMMFANGKIKFEALAKKYPVLSYRSKRWDPVHNYHHTFGYEIAERFNKQVNEGTFNLDEFVGWVAAKEREYTAPSPATTPADASCVKPTPEEVVA